MWAVVDFSSDGSFLIYKSESFEDCQKKFLEYLNKIVKTYKILDKEEMFFYYLDNNITHCAELMKGS